MESITHTNIYTHTFICNAKTNWNVMFLPRFQLFHLFIIIRLWFLLLIWSNDRRKIRPFAHAIYQVRTIYFTNEIYLVGHDWVVGFGMFYDLIEMVNALLTVAVSFHLGNVVFLFRISTHSFVFLFIGLWGSMNLQIEYHNILDVVKMCWDREQENYRTCVEHALNECRMPCLFVYFGHFTSICSEKLIYLFR